MLELALRGDFLIATALARVCLAAALTAHEGQHVVDQRSGIPQHGLANTIAEETRAFTTQSYVNQSLGVKSAYGIWDPSWPADKAEANRQSAGSDVAKQDAEDECKDHGCL